MLVFCFITVAQIVYFSEKHEYLMGDYFDNFDDSLTICQNFTVNFPVIHRESNPVVKILPIIKLGLMNS